MAWRRNSAPFSRQFISLQARLAARGEALSTRLGGRTRRAGCRRLQDWGKSWTVSISAKAFYFMSLGEARAEAAAVSDFPYRY